MTPQVWGTIGLVVLGLIGATMIVFPRRWARIARLGMYEEEPTPRPWYVASICISGVIVLVGSLGLIAVVTTPTEAAPDRTAEPELIVEAQRTADLVEQCYDVRQPLSDAIALDENGLIANVAEVEALADELGVAVRPFEEEGVDGVRVLLVDIGGIAAFGIPNPPADACRDFGLRLMS